MESRDFRCRHSAYRSFLNYPIDPSWIAGGNRGSDSARILIALYNLDQVSPRHSFPQIPFGLSNRAADELLPKVALIYFQRRILQLRNPFEAHRTHPRRSRTTILFSSIPFQLRDEDRGIAKGRRRRCFDPFSTCNFPVW